MKKKAVLFLLISISCSAFNTIAYSLTRTTSSSDMYYSLKETITALDVTRKISKKELKELHKIQNASLKKDINEYNIFIEYLSYQINSYCTEIYNNFGKDALDELPCKINVIYNSNQNRTNTATNKNIQTTEEQINTLDNEFLASLGEFDEMLLKEEEQLAVKSRKNQTTADTDGGFSNEYKQQNKNKEKSNKKKSSEREVKTDKEEKNSHPKNKTYGKGSQQSSGKEKSSRRRKLDEIDDDIVARQLKEAAEKQSDPELKEKLWQEYYKYKEKTVK